MIQELPVQPATARKVPVRNVLVYLTEDCNLRCTYCFVEKKPRRMSRETALRAVDFIRDPQVSGRLRQVGINFFGGEPFLELDRMEEVVDYARRPRPNLYERVDFSATTNGTIAGPRVERLVRRCGMRLLVSMDGDRAASTHRPFAAGRSSYDLVARNLPKLAEWAPDLIARVTYHPRSLDLVAKVRHVLELGAPRVALCPVEESDWEAAADRLEAAYQELADWFLAETRSGRVPPLEISAMLLQRLHAFRTRGVRIDRPCGVGAHLLGIDPDGNVMPCHRFLYRREEWLGTVESPELSPERMQYVHLSARDILGCESCSAEPVCGGGCRAVARNAGLGLHEAWPGHCFNMRAHLRALTRTYETLVAEGNRPFLDFLNCRGCSRTGDVLSELARS